MNILGIDDTLAGLRRGAAKFGTRVAERVARKFGVRKNAKVPAELTKAIESVLDDVAREHAPGDTPMRVSHMVGRILRKAGSKFHYEDVSAALSDELDRRGWSRHQMSNSFTPREPEPYGLGMGGADTEQASQPPTQARENAGPRLVYEKTGQEVKVGDKVKDFRGDECEVTAIPRPPSSRASEGKIELDGVEYYAGVAGAKWVDRADGRENADGAPTAAPSSGAVDSSSLGYESGQKTTTAARADFCDSCDSAPCHCVKNSPEMLSRCLGCGLESPEAKVSKCMGCGLEDADTGQRMPLAALTDRENDKRDDAFREMQAYKKHLDKLYAEQGREPRFLEDDARQEMIRDLEKKVSELSQKWMALSRENSGACDAEHPCEFHTDDGQHLRERCRKCGATEDEARVSGSLKNAAHPDLKAWWDQADLSQRELLLEDAGASGSHQMATLHFENLPADVKRKMESMRGTLSNSRANAGHLGPDAWEAATESERVDWLDAASQDIDLACRRWPDLSLDVHVALQDAFDKPANRNLTDALDHNGRGQLIPLADRLNASGGDYAAVWESDDMNAFLRERRDLEEVLKAGYGGAISELSAQPQMIQSAFRQWVDRNVDRENAAGRAPTFVFRDEQGEDVSVTAKDEAAAWQQMSQDFGTPVADMRGMGIKLVRTVENATNDPKYKCSKCGEVTQASGPDEVVLKCPKCGGATDMQNAANKVVDFECVKCHHKFQTGVDYDNFDPTNYPKCPKCGGDDILDNASDASGRILACPSCKSTRLVAADKPMYGSGYYECDACGDGTWSRDELAKMGSFKNAKRDEPCPKCKLPMKMRPADAPVDSDQYRCGNRRCTEFRTESGAPSEHFRKLNSNREEHEKLKEDLLKKLKEAKAAGDTLEAESIEKNLIKVSELLKNDSPGDVEEIERHVEGIEHELKEIKGLDNSGVQRGSTKYGQRQNASFVKGDRVRSDVDAQGMHRGELGTIEDTDEQSTAFGTFVTYSVKLDSGKTVAVRNGHLVLSRA